MKKFFNVNTILIGIVVIAALGGLVYYNFTKTEGSRAMVAVDGNKERMYIDLTKSDTYEIDATLPVTLDVKDGKIAFVHSQCADKLCEGFGYIGNEDEIAVCLPAGVAVTVVKGE